MQQVVGFVHIKVDFIIVVIVWVSVVCYDSSLNNNFLKGEQVL
jgi:hypothetical protein